MPRVLPRAAEDLDQEERDAPGMVLLRVPEQRTQKRVREEGIVELPGQPVLLPAVQFKEAFRHGRHPTQLGSRGPEPI